MDMMNFLLSQFRKLIQARNIMWPILTILVILLNVRMQSTYEAAEDRLERFHENHTQRIDRLYAKIDRLHIEIHETKDRMHDQKVELAELKAQSRSSLRLLESIQADCIRDAGEFSQLIP